MKATPTRPKIVVTGGGRAVVGHVGARLLADLADVTGLTSTFSQALAGLRQRQGGHDPGRIAVDLAVMLADGGEAIADLAVLRDQNGLFGPVASDPTAWRLLAQLDDAMLAEIRTARAATREVAWAQHAETRGDLPAPKVAGRPVPGLTLDMDASIVLCHSEKESATRTWKKTFGYHPLFCFLDNTGEALSGLLREGRAGSNTTTDHITVLDHALAQIPDAHRHGTPILLRSDSAGSSHGFLAHIRGLREQNLDIRFSVGVAITEPVRQAIRTATNWIPAVDVDGDLREHAEVCEITGLFPADGFPDGTRFIVRRERPHPGAQLTLFDTIEGWRHQVIATDTPPGNGSLQFLEARHRAHARVEDRIRTGKHRLRPVPVAGIRDQPGLAATRPDRHRPACLDPNPAARQRPRPRRTQETTLPAPARRRPHHPHRPPNPAGHRRTLALDGRPGHRLHPAERSTPTRRLTTTPLHPNETPGGTRPTAGSSPCPKPNPPTQRPIKSTDSDQSRLSERRRLT